MRSAKELPRDYVLSHSIDLSKNIIASTWLQIASILSFPLFGYAFLRLGSMAQPNLPTKLFEFKFDLYELSFMLAAIIILPILHEGVRGAFFKLITDEKPKIEFGILSSCASAPDWYFAKQHYLLIASAPLVILTTLGLAIMPMLPAKLVPALIMFLSLNASGSVGDQYLTLKLSILDKAMIKDYGEKSRCVYRLTVVRYLFYVLASENRFSHHAVYNG